MRRPTTTLFTVVKLKKPNGKRHWMIHRRSHGHRERHYFETEKEARREMADRNRKIDAHGTTVKLTPEEQIFAQACMADLAPYGKTLRDAVDYFLKDHGRDPAPSGNELADRVIEEYVSRLERKECSVRHLESVRETARKFRSRFGDTPIDKISAEDIKEWLSDLPLAVKTRNRHLGYIATMFQLAVKKNFLEKNPLAGVDKFSDPRNGQPVSIFTAEELQTVLSAAKKEWLPQFAINAFTGLRREEINRLDWSEIKLDHHSKDMPFGVIKLPPEKSKNGRRKLIQIPQNLAAILRPLAKKEGLVRFNTRVDLEIKRLKEELGIEWPQNVLRHSFCSHAVALHGFIWTSRQAQHTEHQLREDYYEMVTEEAAERYFNVEPVKHEQLHTDTSGYDL
jgi:integrase